MATSTAPQPATNEGECVIIGRVPEAMVNMCNLNASLTCSENTATALHGCLLYSIIGGIIILLITCCVIIGCCCLVRFLRKRRKKRGVEYSRIPQGVLMKSVASTEQPHISPSSHGYEELEENKLEQSEENKLEQSGGHRPRTYSHEARNEVRQMQSIKEKDEVRSSLHPSFKPLPDLGSRLQKHWYQKTENHKEVLKIVVKISRQCRLNLEDPDTIKTLNDLLHEIKHPHLLYISEITYKKKFVAMKQDFISRGSIRDYLFKSKPEKDWEVKYQPSGGRRSFPPIEIFKCGAQILQAAEVLYDLGFTSIRQIHSGNVFISATKDYTRYILGGYENSLLGYRTSIYSDISEEGLLDKIDVIMFGHLLYEMCTQNQLVDKLQLEDEDLTSIGDQEKEIIQFIFNTAKEDETQSNSMLKISYHRLFKSLPQSLKKPEVKPIRLTEPMMQLIRTVFPRDLNMEVIFTALKGKYSEGKPLPKLGWRSEKMWAETQHSQLHTEGLVTVVEVPAECPVFLDSDMEDFKTLLSHEKTVVFSIKDIDYVKVDKHHYIVIFQDILDSGSLRDRIYGTSPYRPYATKYKCKGKVMNTDKVINCGRQILQHEYENFPHVLSVLYETTGSKAMYYLAHLDGSEDPLVLGCVHTGNIFIEGDVCRLGGFENTIFGHCTRKHYKCNENNLSTLDIVMFGHAIFEMSTGRELMKEKPSKEDYDAIPKDLQPPLSYIFGNENPTMAEVMNYFKVSPLSSNDLPSLTTKQKIIVEKVRKRKARDQNDFMAKGKYLFQSNFRSIFKK